MPFGKVICFAHNVLLLYLQCWEEGSKKVLTIKGNVTAITFEIG
jgi:hypothetical protein